MALALPRHWFLVSGPAPSNAVCLTFDDGPHPVHTPRILDALKVARVPGTFFVVGERAAQYPDIIRRIVGEGHTLGHHTFFHREPSQTSTRALLTEVVKTRATLAEIVGREPALFRPPHGKLTVGKCWRLWRCKQTIVLWNVDPKDFACRTSGELRDWFRRHPVRGGDIVLLHDNQPHAGEALCELIESTRERGLTFTTPEAWTR
jgi:peptidoglycan/xylan/chitin deacetylase (PgdA/CDA1 family)